MFFSNCISFVLPFGKLGVAELKWLKCLFK